jgi:hypothetical protein
LASARWGEERREPAKPACTPGRAFFWFLFFARAKKRNLPWVSHPQVAVEIARKARDTIQDLDSRFRGNDRKPKAAHQAAFVSSGGLRRFAPNTPYI